MRKVKWSNKIMVKKHQRGYIYTTRQRTFLKQLENFRTCRRISKYGRKPVLIILLTLFNYWSNQMEKLIAAVKIFLLTRLRLQQYMCKFMKAFSYLRLSIKERKISIKKNEISVGSCTSISHISQNCSSV